MPGVAKRHAGMKTPSVCVFKYELSEYPSSADVTPEQARTSGANLPGEVPVLRVGPQRHPEVDVEAEMIAKIVNFIRTRPVDLSITHKSRRRYFCSGYGGRPVRLVMAFGVVISRVSQRISTPTLRPPGLVGN
jgi:hypothetical protein